MTLLMLAAAAALLVIVAAPDALAAFGTVYPTDDDLGVPIDQISAGANLWVYTVGDIEGGKVCVVKEATRDPGDGSLNCAHPAWGTPNRIGSAVGSHWTMIETVVNAPLRRGTFRIAADGGTKPGDDALSDPFTVYSCPPGNCPILLSSLQQAQAYKDRAKGMRDALAMAKYGLEGAELGKTLSGKIVPDPNEEIIEDMVSTWVKGSWSSAPKFVQTQLEKKANDALNKAYEFANSNSAEEKAMALAKAVTDRALEMYDDVYNDPADPFYMTVVAPDFQPPDISSGDASLDAAAGALDRVTAYGAAGLHAYERYQGAVADGSQVGEHRQMEAMAANDFSLVDSMHDAADGLRTLRAKLAADPAWKDVVISQDNLDVVRPALQRLEADGFTDAERNRLYDLELDDGQIAQLRAQLVGLLHDLDKLPDHVKLVDILAQAAQTLDDGTAEFETFARLAEGGAGASNTAPTATFPVPVNLIDPGVGVALDGSNSTDDSKIVSYDWSFDDGQTASGAQVTHAFATGGDHLVTLTVTDDDGATGAFSGVVHIRVPAPKSTAKPVVTGTARDGEVLQTTDGTWDGPYNFTYQWQRCDAGGANCADVDNAQGNAYPLTPDDVGHRVRAVVTAINGGGETAAASNATAVIAAIPVTASASPGISGTARSGLLLTGTDGTFAGTPPINVERRWARCDLTGGSCTTIAGQADATYQLTDDDVGHTIRFQDRVTNPAGTTTFSSDKSDPVLPAVPPKSTAPPSISGSAADFATLHADPGTWDRDPLNFEFQWRRCAAGGTGCADIDGAVNQDYVLTSADVGHVLVVRVHATDALGGASATSDPTGVVAAVAPSIAPNRPAVGATGFVDGTLVGANVGPWDGTTPMAFAYQWQRCDQDGNGCADIPGETDADYALSLADVGHRVRVVVTASNAGGQHSEPSDPTDVVAPLANTYVPALGYAVTDIVKGFLNGVGGNPIGIAVGADGSIYVAQYGGDVYKLPPSGGTVSSRNQVTRGLTVIDMAFDKEGNMFATDTIRGVIEIDLDHPDKPVKRVLATCGGLGIAVDPLSDDVFLNGCDAGTARIQGTHTEHPQVVPYAGVGGDGLTFGPDGTLYTAAGGSVVSISGTDKGPVVTKSLADVPTVDGIAVAAGSDPSTPPFILGNRNDGKITKVDLTRDPPVQQDIVTGGTRGDFADVGPDGCLYAIQSYTVAKVTNADGTCSLAPSSPDRVAPTTTATRSIAANAAGWNRRAVGVEFDATDNPGGSGVKDVAWSSTGAHAATGDDDGVVSHVLVTEDGTTAVTYHATDRARNREADRTLEVKIDRSKPTVTIDGLAEGATVAQGSSRKASFSCADTGSGLAACDGSVANGAALPTDELGPHTLTITARDLAGNTNVVTRSYTVSDQAPPQSTAVQTPAPNGAGWAATPVRVHLSAVDPAAAGGGLAKLGVRLAAGGGLSGSGVANITWSTTGAASGGATVVGAGADVAVGALGTTTLRWHATDAAGNAEGEHTLVVRVDPTAPQLSIARPFEGEHLAQGSDVRASSSCADEDGGSGVASCTGTGADGTAVDTRTLGEHTIALTGADRAGNAATLARTYVVDAPGATSATSLTAVRDVTAPAITITSPAADAQVVKGADLAARYSCADEPGGSGLASCAGTAPAAVADGGALGTDVLGAHTLTVVGVDKAGNRASASRTWTVVAPAKAADVVRLPSTRRCASRRRFAIHLRAPKGVRLVSARVTVNRKAMKALSGARLGAAINLTGLPKGAFTVRIVATTAAGQELTSTRRYHTCAPKKRA